MEKLTQGYIPYRNPVDGEVVALPVYFVDNNWLNPDGRIIHIEDTGIFSTEAAAIREGLARFKRWAI